MRRCLLLLALAVAGFSNAGCILNVYDADPNLRMQTLLNQSEDLRQLRDEYYRFWMIDQPSHMTAIRTNGAVGP